MKKRWSLLFLLFVMPMLVWADNIWGDGYSGVWLPNEGCYSLRLRFYDSEGRDDAIKDGDVSLDGRRLFDIDSWHQNYPYKVTFKVENQSVLDDYDVLVRDGNNWTWVNDIQSHNFEYSERNSSKGDGYYYYLKVCLYPKNWLDVTDRTVRFNIWADKVDRNNLVFDNDCNHDFFCSTRSYETKDPDFKFEWRNNQKLYLLWTNKENMKNGGNTKTACLYLDRYVDNKFVNIIKNTNCPTDLCVSDLLNSADAKSLQNISTTFKLRIDMLPASWNTQVAQTFLNKESPVFLQPLEGTFDAVYVAQDEDNEKSYVLLQWDMPETSGDTYISYPFLLKRINTKTGEIKEFSVDYQHGKTHYSYQDESFKEGENSIYRYTLQRNNKMDGYPLLESSNVEVKNEHFSPDSLMAEVDETGTKIRVSWKDNGSIWSAGTTCTLTQINVTDYNSRFEYKLTKEQYINRYFIDERVRNCNDYEYQIIMHPGDMEHHGDWDMKVPLETDGAVTPFVPGKISEIEGSKGYFTDRTEISWHTENAFDNFIVDRKVYGEPDETYKQIGSTQYEQTMTDFVYEDKKGSIGTIYQYRVRGATACGADGLKYSNALEVVGFRSSTGIISGRVTYENGQAVQGVEILPKTEGLNLGKAIRLTGTGQIVSEKQLELTENDFSIEAYLRPTMENSGRTVFSIGTQRVVYFNSEGLLTFSLGNYSASETKYRDISGTYYHFSAVYIADTMRLYVDTMLVAQTYAPKQKMQPGTFIIGATQDVSKSYNSHYVGYMDEVRVWNKGLTSDEIKRDYTRQLYGGEAGLLLYYRFNEGVDGEVYDVSFVNDTYNEMHAVATGMEYVTNVTELPTEEQLFVKGITDVNGNYTINGVPYVTNGTEYRIIPRYGTHDFDPKEKLVNMSETNRNFTADFVDKSSFTLQGYVYYSESTIPVPGVMFEIDGVTAMQDNKIVETGSDGQFRINVPVGRHKVQAVKKNHVFRNDGLLLDLNGENRFYDAPVEGVVFRDETRVRLVGRVAGGPVQQAFPLGHSLSTNNLGEELGVTLTLSGSSSDMYDIYDDEQLAGTPGKVDSKTEIVEHFRPSYWDKEQLTNVTTVTYTKKSINVIPTSKTGEFYVDLIPTVYTITTASASGHGNFLENNVTLNVTDSLLWRDIFYEYVIPEDMRKAGKDTIALDTVSVLATIQLIKRVAPTLEVVQLDKKGEPMDYWGDSKYIYTGIDGIPDTIQIYFPENVGEERYMFGKPVMTQNNLYKVQASVFEAYSYYDKDGTPVGGREDRVPVTDGIVNFTNNLLYEAATDTVHVSEDGMVYYNFIVGNPSLSGNGTKSMEINVKVDEMTIDDKEMLDVIVLGCVPGNANFVTQGPDLITTVLRDPPGSNSYSFLEAGTSYEYSSTYIGSMNLSQEAGALVSAKTTLKTFSGMGAGVIAEVEGGEQNAFTAIFEENVEGQEGTVSRMTFTNRWQTSDDPAYVGADADVYIGKSTNVIIGTADAVEIVRNGEFDPDFVDNIMFQGPDYSLIQREALSMGVKFSTAFAYPQIHIEEVLIPQLKSVMASQFTAGKDSAELQLIANEQKKIFYTTDITDVENENYGRPGYYHVIVPEDKEWIKNQANLDTILTLRQSIDNWEKAIRDNEMKKVTATGSENLSFQGGTSIERTMEFAGSDVTVKSFSIMTGAHQNLEVGSFINKTGVSTTLDFVESMAHGGEFSTSNEASRTFGFVLAEDGTDYISVDVRKVNNDQKLDEILKDAGGDFGMKWSELLNDADLKGEQEEYVFITRGGATSCPYEGGYTTKYYKDASGNPVVVDQPTAQMEKPVLTAKEYSVVNVPSSRRAVFELHLGNESETGDDQYFMLSLIDESNPYGAKFYIDGAALGDGRTFLVPAGGELVKTLEVEKGTEMIYENLQLCLHSTCQYDPTGFQDLIESTIGLNVQFVPSSTDLTLAAPLDQWVLNTFSPKDEQGRFYLPVKINKFDVNYEYFHHIDIEIKPSAASDNKWVTKARFYKDETVMNGQDVDNYSGEKYLIGGPEIIYNLTFDSISDVDQRYDVRAVSASLVQNKFVKTVTPIASGVKDTYRPRLFGQPQPANGILGVEDEVRLNFNETIAAGYITSNDIRATGVRNGSLNTYSASVNFDGISEYAETELQKNFMNKTFTIETNLQIAEHRDAVVFAMGNMEVGFDANGFLLVKIGDMVVKSAQRPDYQEGEWEHLAVVYEHGTQPTITAYYNLVQVIGTTPVNSYSGVSNSVIGASLMKDRFFKGKMNEFRIWADDLSLLLNKNRGIVLSGTEAGLLAYYPMSAGKGSVLEDVAGGNHAVMHATWSINNPGYAAFFFGKGYTTYNMSNTVVSDDMDYTLEFWFKSEPGNNAEPAAMISTGKANVDDNNGGNKHIYVGFENAKLITRNSGYTNVLNTDYRDNKWHHYALTVSRSMNKASVYIDGNLESWFTASNFSGLSSDMLTIGACNWLQKDEIYDIGIPSTGDYFTGYIDEVRLWNVCMNKTMIEQRNNTRMDGIETGLMFYVPFEDYLVDDNQISNLDFVVYDQSINKAVAQNRGALESEDAAGIKDVVTEATIAVDAVVNNDALIINPTSEALWNDFEQQIVTFTVTGIQDVNGNEISSPIVWTAFINRNHIKWSEPTVSVEGNLYEGIDFSVDIVNIGGMYQNYTLQNVPSWLSVSAESGTIKPQSSITIDFHVDEALNVGTYDQVIYLINENGVARALSLIVKINGETPDWNVNPADYRYNMNIYGKLKIDNIFSTDKEDMIAAFHNGECVGVAYNSYIKEYDMWYALLTVYSNEYKHDELEFRIWDASTGTIFLGNPSKHIVFDNDVIEGTPINPIVFETQDMQIQNVMLEQGWNWISFNVSNEPNTFDRLFGNGDWMDGDQIKDETNNTFAAFGKDRWIGLMSEGTVSSKYMYLVNTTNAQMLSLSGAPLKTQEERTVPLRPNWNYIAFLPTSNLTVKEALSGYEAVEGDVVKDQSNFAMYSEHVGWLGTLDYMKPGVGYMFYRAAADSSKIIYPIYSVNRSAQKNAKWTETDRRVETNEYPFNMSVIAVVDENMLEEGDRVVALIDGKCHGVAKPVFDKKEQRTLCFMTVNGDERAAVTFAIERNGEIVAQSNGQTYFVSDAILGTIQTPYVIDFTVRSVQVYPTFFSDKLNVNITTGDDSNVDIYLMDVSGRVLRFYHGVETEGYNSCFVLDGLSNLSTGLYMVNVKINGENNIYKVEKK